MSLKKMNHKPRHKLQNLAFCIAASLCISFPGASYAGFTSYGKGNISDTINPQSYTCSHDHGTWIGNAGIVAPGVSGCNPIGEPTPIYPHLVDEAAKKPTATHRWWGSLSFYGEMTTGDPSKAAYITPDPITARITEKGVRMMGMPGGLRTTDNINATYTIPDPFNEVFDGMAIGNTAFDNMKAYLKDFSDGTATAQWKQNDQVIMEATFVHGSPYVYFKVYQGQLQIRTRASDGNEKAIFHNGNDTLGVKTDVAENRNYFLITGEGKTSFQNPESNAITISNTSGEIAVAVLPVTGDQTPDESMINDFTSMAHNRVSKVNIDYSIDHATNMVSVSHHYLDAQGQPVKTYAGLMPLNWKNSSQQVSNYKVRSARGMVKFAKTSDFTYTIPFVGVLPSMPAGIGDYDPATLTKLIDEFLNKGEAAWNTANDTYWAGKNYGKVAELAAIARNEGLTKRADRLVNWLKGELEDWFRANTSGQLDVHKYFYYDKNWNTLLGMDESYGTHQQLNDHHFHYGYFIRAAAEICRVDANWCSKSQWGSMIEMLIRDYAAGRDDPMFPYMRNFDPANGFSWASGHANFALGNNNESTSEAANAYGAIVLYGLATGQQDLVDRGMYLHASTTSSYWEYWNNIDRFRGNTGDRDNFLSDYEKMTTSIIWGNGSVFATWFSAAYAHILGIQGLPLSPLVFHVGQYADYLKDYVKLGLSQSSNGKPSGLGKDQWRDIWWNILSMTDGDAAVEDFNSMNTNYTPENGESKAHTYHWIHTFKQLGHLATGTGELTADHPAAVAFDNNGVKTYLAYNYGDSPETVRFSDGTSVTVPAHQFNIGKASSDDSQNGGADSGDSGNTDNGGADSGDSGNTDNGGADNGDSGNTDNGGADNGDSGNTDNGSADNGDSGNTDNGSADNGDSGNTDNGGADNGDSGSHSNADCQNKDMCIMENAEGYVVYQVSFPQKMTEVRLFARHAKNQGNFLVTPSLTEKQNDDGTFTYSYVDQDNTYSAGDTVIARFYGFSMQTGQVFIPGPNNTDWSDTFTY